MTGWRALGLFWLAVLVLLGASAAALQAMGPPVRAVQAASRAAPPVTADTPAATPVSLPPPPKPGGGPLLGDRIPEPDPALLEPAPDFPGAQLPRIGPDGRKPMQVYAPHLPPTDTRPKVAFLLVGMGLSDGESRAAAETLPPGITLGISPYTPEPAALLDDVRAHGHEFLVTLPMESQGYPLNDSGPRALLTGADPAENARNLEWVLSRIRGAAGVTGASDGLRGERFANMKTTFGPVLAELAKRGLLYVDPRPDQAVAGAAVDVTTIVDDQVEGRAIDAKLAELEQRARDGQPAIGLAGPLRPVTVDRIAAWARGLDARGIALAPVSAFLPK